MKIRFIILALLFSGNIVVSQNINQNTTVTFYAIDSVQITADTYFINNVEPTILLCHQAGFSRGEYVKTAKTE